jgi:protein O-GlcNAc transferase
VRFAQTYILGRLRRQIFFSLAEANQAIAGAVERINAHVMRRLGVTPTPRRVMPCGRAFLSCTGRSFASRVAGSILYAVGLPKLVISSVAQYEATALRLAQSPDELAGLRRRLADALTRSPLFDTARQTRAIEAAFAEMWRLYAAGESPRAFAVDTV